MSLIRAITFTVLLAAVSAAESLPELIGEALKMNPEILAVQKKYEAARQRPAQESSLPDPMVSMGYAAVGSPRPIAGLGTEPLANAGVMVSQELPYPGKLKLKGEMAAREADAAFQEYQATELRIVSRVKQAYFRLQYSYAAANLLERNRDLLDKLLKVTENRYSVGKAAQQDVFKSQAQISIVQTRLVRLEQDRHSREAEINALLNRAPGSPVPRPEAFQPKITPLVLEDLFAAARRNSPMLGRDRKMIERSEAAVNMARKEYYPDVTLNGGYYNMGTGMPPMYEFRADLKIPLYFWRKQRAGVNEQVNNLSQARRTLEATDQDVRYRIQDDYQMALSSAKLMDLYRSTVVPQANLALESSLSTYETGTVDFLSVLSNFTMVLDYEMNYYDEALNYSLALARLEEMTGERLVE